MAGQDHTNVQVPRFPVDESRLWPGSFRDFLFSPLGPNFAAVLTLFEVAGTGSMANRDGPFSRRPFLPGWSLGTLALITAISNGGWRCRCSHLSERESHSPPELFWTGELQAKARAEYTASRLVPSHVLASATTCCSSEVRK